MNDSGDKLTGIWQGLSQVKSFTYDAAGRTTAITEGAVTTNFSYDYEDRIMQITRSGMTTNSFGYSGVGTRVAKTDSGGTASYMRNGIGVTAPVLSDGSASFTPGISERRSSITKHYSSDVKNTVAQLDTSQAISASKQYDAFGNVASSSGTWNGSYSYGGKFGYQTEPDSGLMLLGHRYYDSTTGRFISRDPIGDGENWYAYCHGNPVFSIDPLGYQEHPSPDPSPVEPGGTDEDTLWGRIRAVGRAILSTAVEGTEPAELPGLGVLPDTVEAGIEIAELAKHMKAKWPTYHSLSDGDPETVDPRDLGLPQWWDPTDGDPTAEKNARRRYDYYRAKGYPDSWFKVLPRYTELI